ncbi:DMT family transporter [Aquabacterium sp.]|uniref:DMT family transporter n=1 Tax=Aquabacterium sp. TaxID=1872578 RepID=UPI001994FDBD|nr:DMT family transporter [Aquabacterium sp.]MBC7701288.1 DMT family transporter [Aquabacterium sp.]
MSTATLPAPPPTWLPVSVLLFSASLWGLSWWPLKQFSAAGLSGPWLALLTYGVVGLCGLPFLWRERRQWRAQLKLLILLGLIGGWANAAFVNALVLGQVVRVMLLFYLSPVWAVLGGKLFLNEDIGWRRALAVALALAGAFLVIGGPAAFEQPFSLSDLLALSAGMGFAGNNIVARAAQGVPMLSKTITVFVGCGLVSVAMLAWQLTPAAVVVPSLQMGAGLLAYGFIWLALATATWQFGVTHMESGRAGVILIAELLVAVLSSTLLGEEHLSASEWCGGALIAAAALLETTGASPSPACTAAT